LLAFVLALAFVFGTFAAMVPTTAEASGMGGHPPKHAHMAKNNAHFSPNQLPNPFVRDFDGDCEWWRYELRGGRYVRVYCPCKYGDAEISYRRDVRAQWANYDFSQEIQPAD
jgi:hypothetical protein